MSGEMPDLPLATVIIPTYNGRTLIRACLECLLESPPAEVRWEIVVVDDGSTDGTVSALSGYGPPVRLVCLGRNSGFATACNEGSRSAAASSEYLVFLNNDTLPVAGWLDALVDEAVDNPAVAAVGAKLLFRDGTVQHAGVAIGQDGWPRHLYTGFPGEHPAVNREKNVVAATAACLLVRRRDFAALGGFDAAFHNGYEDIDFCLRLREHGHATRYCPRAVVYHLESVTRWRSGPQSTAENDRLFADRWRATTSPDDVKHYFDDGLLSIDYGAYYPATVTISPYLAVVDRDGEGPNGVESLLAARSRQVMDLLAWRTRAALAKDIACLPAVSTTGANRTPPHRTPIRGQTVEIGRGTPRHLVSLLMPVKNEGTALRELIPLVLGQSAPALLEIVAVDSGSTDDTLEVLNGFGATVLSIDPADFDHGLTRNLAAENAKGDVLLFLNGRTRPVDENWLGPLLAALDDDPAVVGVCSRLVPHPGADALVRRDLILELSGSAFRQRKQITDVGRYRAMTVEQRREYLNFHTVSAAIRADTFSRLPFRSVRTIGEDLLWAREVIEAGWALVHEPRSVAYHSHAYSLRELFSRNVDDGVANRDITGRTLDAAEVLPLINAMVESDWSHLKTLDLTSREELESWQREALLRRVAQVIGQWVGINYEKLPEGMVETFSRVAHNRGTRA